MGQVILKSVSEKFSNEFKVIAGICSNNSFGINKESTKVIPVFKNFKEILASKTLNNIKPDVIIDFSSPTVLDDLLSFALKNKLPTVIGTTGHTKEQLSKIDFFSNEIPLFFSGNMSVGLNLMLKACKDIASVLGETCDVEIIEKHHRGKKDAPSGTALMLANAITCEFGNKNYIFNRAPRHKSKESNEIGISSVRTGTIVGEHSVIFGLNNESITLTHNAESRNIFANGAIMAAKFLIKQKPGLYNMENLCECIKCY